MKPFDIPYQRLVNQHLVRQTFQKPGEVIRWFGAVQAQDYAAAKWAVAQRTKGLAGVDHQRQFAFVVCSVSLDRCVEPSKKQQNTG